MRAVVAGGVLVAVVGTALAQPDPYSSAEGKYSAKFPGPPKVTSKTTKSAVGELTVNFAIYANADGGAFLISHTDYPAAATKPENHKTLFDAVRDDVKGRDGKISDEKELAYGPDKLPGREFAVEKDKQRIRYRVLLCDNRLFQIAVIGSKDFVAGKEAGAFLDSFQVTK